MGAAKGDAPVCHFEHWHIVHAIADGDDTVEAIPQAKDGIALVQDMLDPFDARTVHLRYRCEALNTQAIKYGFDPHIEVACYHEALIRSAGNELDHVSIEFDLLQKRRVDPVDIRIAQQANAQLEGFFER